MRQTNQTGLFAGVREVIDKGLGVDNYATRRSARQLAKCGIPPGAGALVSDVFETLDQNWKANGRSSGTSRQNFRWRCPKTAISSHNRSAEITLERALIDALQRTDRRDWSNQVPLISGMGGPYAFRRRAVDLVQYRGGRSIEFVELKVESDTPVFAAVEILVYGLLWLLSRRNRQHSSEACPILDADDLTLSVLAPRAFYCGQDMDTIAKSVNDGLQALGERHGVTMRLRFTAFPLPFSWSADPAVLRPLGQDLIALLDNREAV